MHSAADFQVVLLGFGRDRTAASLIAQLRASGVSAGKAPACELTADLRGRLAVLINYREGYTEALASSASVRSRAVSCTAGVLIDAPEFSQSQRLTDAGAIGFRSQLKSPRFRAPDAADLRRSNSRQILARLEAGAAGEGKGRN
jgi:hypothetical protein